MQRQLESKWCWAATSTSVTLFYDPASSWTQCKLANKVKGRSDCCGSGASGPCNEGDRSAAALTVTGHFNRSEDGPAAYGDVAAEIAGGFPIVVRTAWSGGGAHAIAITGYDHEEERLLTIADPIYGFSVYRTTRSRPPTGTRAPGRNPTTRGAEANVPITFSNPPPSALEAARSGMRSIVAAGRFGDAALRAAAPTHSRSTVPSACSS